MSEYLDEFGCLLDFARSGGPYEATFGIWKDLARKDKLILSWISKELQSTIDSIRKADLARIAVIAGENGQFESFLREFEQWEDFDFASL